MAKRNYIFDNIKSVYEFFGFRQIETPAMENLSTLLGKYGEEGDKLLFKILNSGDFLKEVNLNDVTVHNASTITTKISEKGLRYDLTVPFARYVVQHRNEIQFPFKRYQIQSVWRADRPQKGRYREFFQCDADVIGSNSLLNELELIQIIDNVFKKLNINVVIKINNRKILAGIAERIGFPELLVEITVALDKFDKIGAEAVIEEMTSKGIDEKAIEQIKPLMNLQNMNAAQKLSYLATFLETSSIGTKGIAEIEEILNLLNQFNIHNEIEVDLTLARGLNYYTGAIFEVVTKEVKMGSICGGGRYDNLTGIFGLNDVSGVGISFGADRIYDVLTELDRFPDLSFKGTQVLILNFGKKEELEAISILEKLRQAGLRAELFPDSAKMNKQMTYANHHNIPFVIFAGESEIQSGLLGLKNMNSGIQQSLQLEEIIKQIISIDK
jgi:histidyl-tRNA synthetase